MKEKIELPLGKEARYNDQYDNSLLVGIPRGLAREEIKISASNLPFNGIDLWNCYEVSWLTPSGKPCVRIVKFAVPIESEFLVESKSVKLYFNSLNGTKFTNENEVLKTIQKDLSQITQSDVLVFIQTLESYAKEPIVPFEGINIDELDVEISDYSVNTNLLEVSQGEEIIKETLCSNLLKSNCLVTNQPDWASIQIKYVGKKINHASLLKYLISFRNHNEFHEQCVEHIFSDIIEKCTPSELTVYAKYTRRGGVDINPFRTTLSLENLEINKYRDIRQ
jgi:7-cyano-7-deazaguanine reductase